MADINDPGFSSLDPLGPEYGKINAPRLDSKGLAPFEGGRLEMPKINFPEPERFTPVIPNVQNLNNPAKSIQNNVVGVPPNKPGLNKKAAHDQLVSDMRNYARNKIRANQDPNQYAKIYSYNAGPDGNAFYKRYQAYGQETFDKIGFSPLRDNEALFNSRTTQWDDFSRMMQHSFLPLFSQGFISGPKSLAKMFKGDFTGTDLEDAAAYEEAAAIGQSSKGGVGGFLTNSMMNFAYTAGIITEAVLEEVVLAVATGATAGITAPALFTRTVANAGRVFKGVSKAFKTFDFAVDGMKAINKTLKAVDNVKGARDFWNMSKGAVGKINPLASSFEAYKLAKADNLSNLAKAYKTAGGFYRDVRNINMALSEARLEAGMVENHIYDKLYNEYYAKNGKAPDNDTQFEMIKQAKKGSLDTLYWNTGLIYASNLVTFPNIVGPKGGVKGFVKSTIKELSEVSGGKFGNLGKVVYDQTAKKFAFEKNNFINWAKGWARNPIHKSIGNTVGYFKSNFTEGIQENLQEVIGGANERYYTDTFKSKGLQSHNYSKAVAKFDYLKEELGKQFSAQGFETFASGFLMGTFATPLNKLFEYSSIGYNRMFKKDSYQELKDKKLDITNNLINTLNQVDIKDFLDSTMFNYGRQEIISKIKESGSKKEALDADNEALLEQMDYLLRKGSFESFKTKLYDLQQLTPEEFEDNVPTVPKGEGAKYQAKINDTIQKMDRINSRYKTYKEKYENPVDLNNLPEVGTPEYMNAVSLHAAWEETIKNAVFFNETFEDTMKRKRDIIQKFNSQKPLQSLSQRDSEVIFDNNRLKNEIGLLKNEIESLKELSDPVSKEELKKKQRKLEAMEKLSGANTKFTSFFNRYQKSAEIRETLQKEKGDEPVTDEEVEAAMDKYFGEFSDDNKIKNLSEYEVAFKEYLKSVADVNQDYLFDEKIDEAFELLIDHQKLDAESGSLIAGVNLLHDPKGFLNLAERNQKWMKDLYLRRGEIYEKMINDEFDTIVDNTLLNELADNGIYVSLEDFAEWQKNGTKPSEFYDHTEQLIIPQETEEYNFYYELFQKASELKEKDPSIRPKSSDEELNESLDQLEEQKQNEINKVPKVLTKISQGNIEPNKSGNITGKMIQDNLQPNMYAEAKLDEETFVFFMDSENVIRENDADGEIVDIKSLGLTFDTVELYTMTEQPNQEYVKEIEKRYEASKDELIKEYDEKISRADKNLELEKNRSEAMATAIKEVKDLFAGKEDIVQTKRNYIVDGELHERMSNRIKANYDTYGYTGEAGLIEVYDQTIGKAFEGKDSFVPTDARANIERRKQEELNNKKEIYNYAVSLNKNKINPNISILKEEKIFTRDGKISEVGFRKIDKTSDSSFITAYNNKIDEINDRYNRELAAVDAKQAPVSTDVEANIENYIQDVSNAKNKEELIKAAEKLVGINPYDDGAVSMATRAALMTPGSFDRGKALFLEEVKSVIEQRRKAEKTQGISTTDARADAEPAPLEQPTETGITQKVIDDFIVKLKAADLPGVNTNKYTLDTVKDELETLVAPKGTRLSKKVQKNISNLEEQLSSINSKISAEKNKTRLDSLNRQKAQLEQAIENEKTGAYDEPFDLTSENVRNFVLNTVKENAFEESRDAGNIIDPMLKDYLDMETSIKPKFDATKMSKEAYDALFDNETGYLTKLKKMADAGDIYIFTKNLIVHANDLVDAEGNKLPPVAGEIDMIIVDKTGKKHIVDLKTGKITKWLNYKTQGTPSYKKQLENTLQQTGYANLVENMSNEKLDIMILPIEIEFNSTGFITRAGVPTNPSIFAGEKPLGGKETEPFTIKLDKGNIIQVKNQETGVNENISIDTFMQRLIPVSGKKSSQIKTSPSPSINIPEEEKDFVNSFMSKLANAGQTKTENEDAFDDVFELYDELDKAKPRLSKESYNMLKKQLDIRSSLLFDKTGDVVLKLGEIYIFTEPVKANKVPEGYRVKIDSFDPIEGTVTVSRVGPGRTKSFTMDINDFNKVAMSEEDINNLPKEAEIYNPTQEEIELLTQSMTNTNDQLSDYEQLAKWEDEASDDTISLDDLKNNFFDNIKCPTK